MVELFEVVEELVEVELDDVVEFDEVFEEVELEVVEVGFFTLGCASYHLFNRSSNE